MYWTSLIIVLGSCVTVGLASYLLFVWIERKAFRLAGEQKSAALSDIEAPAPWHRDANVLAQQMTKVNENLGKLAESMIERETLIGKHLEQSIVPEMKRMNEKLADLGNRMGKSITINTQMIENINRAVADLANLAIRFNKLVEKSEKATVAGPEIESRAPIWTFKDKVNV